MALTRTLMEILNCEKSEKPCDIGLLIEHARKNKVLLQLLKSLRVEGSLRQRQEMAFCEVYEALLEIANYTQNLDYAVIKFFKPIAYVPSDIDLLVKKERLKELVTMLQELGYKYAAVEPNCITLKRDIFVDIYINPDIANMPYISGEELLKFVHVEELHGVKVKRLKNEAEAVLTLSHAIYKEQIITLNDYYTARYYLNKKSMIIAEDLKVSEVLTYSINILREIELGLVEVPLRIPIREVTKLLLLKISKDSLSRKSLPNVGSKLLDRRILMLAKSRLYRQTY